MKIIYGINGTGGGHLTKAREIIPHLQQAGHEIAVIISGRHTSIDVICGESVHMLKGYTFVMNDSGGIHRPKTIRQGLSELRRYPRILRDLVTTYRDIDLVISDFEPYSARLARQLSIPSIALGHQASFGTHNTPRASHCNRIAELFLRWYAPCDHAIGIHFDCYDDFILPPLIQESIRVREVSNHGHITVYLWSYDHEQIAQILSPLDGQVFHIFSPSCTSRYVSGNCHFWPTSYDDFVDSLVSSAGVITGGGFELPAECLYLHKKLLMIPIQGQYEQQCNAAAFEQLGGMTSTRLSTEIVRERLADTRIISLPSSYTTGADIMRHIENLLQKNSLSDG